MRAIDWFYGTWLPASRFVPDHQPSFEAFRGLPFAHGDEYFELTAEFPIVERGIAAMVSIADVADRPPVVFADGAELSLGQ